MVIPGYQIERLIAEGGMASVYLALQESLGRQVALKVLKKFDCPEHATRFLYEGRIIASLNHRNIITIHDIGVIGDRHYIAMEYLEGGSLTDRIAEGMQPPDILDLLERIGECLDFLHRNGIIHRDVKPGNILFHTDGTPKLTDFGIAKQLDDDQDLTMDGSAVGSPYYLSPEQAEGRTLDGRSDIYGLGIIFHQILTGRRPYAENSPIETILAHLTQPIPVLPDEFSAYQGLLERMIAKDPDDRVASARDLVDLVQDVRHSGPEARNDGPANRLNGPGADWLVRLSAGVADRWRSLSKVAKIAVGMLLLSLAAGTSLLTGDLRTHREKAVEIASESATGEASNRVADASDREGTAAAAGTHQQHEPSAPETTTQTLVADEALVAGAQPDGARKQAPLPEAEIAPAAEALPEQPATTESVTKPEDDPAPTIDHWLRAADQALWEYRLTTPAQDNAYAYYQRVIEFDPAHDEALAGLDKIADRYAVLAHKELVRGDYRMMRLYVQRGIEVRSDHGRLLALRTELNELERAATETRRSPRETWQGSKGTGDFMKDFNKLWGSIFD